MTLRLRLALMTLVLGLPLAGLQAWVLFSIAEKNAAEALADFSTSYMQAVGREECEAAPENWVGGRPPRHMPAPPDGPGEPAFAPGPGGMGGPHPPPFGPGGRGPPGRPPRMGGPPDLWPAGDGFGPDRPPQMREISLYAYAADGTSRNPAAPTLDPSLLADLREGQHVVSRRTSVNGRRVHDAIAAMSWRTGPCAIVLARRTGPSEQFSPLSWRPWVPPVLTVLIAVLLAAGPLVRRIRLLTTQVRRYATSRYAEPITVGGRDEIGDLARAFTEAGAEIRQHIETQEAREKALRAFLENTTHDVMIPLTVLQGHLSSLRDQASQGAATDAGTVSAAMGEAHYLGSLMHNLAVAAKLDTGEPNLQRSTLDLNEVVTRVVLRHAPLAKQKGVTLERALTADPLLVEADVTLAEQAVSNLVFNAVRYNKEGGHVAIIAERNATAGRFAIRVIDDGPGIPAEEMSRLVERHFRGNEARTRDPSGQGLGLSIASRAVEMHGWTLKLSASEFGGLQADIEGPLPPTKSL